MTWSRKSRQDGRASHRLSLAPDSEASSASPASRDRLATFGAVAWPLLTALAVVLAMLLSLPVLGGSWRWQGLLLLPLAGVAALSTAHTWQRATGRTWARFVGLGAAGVLLASFFVGLVTQVEANGKPYLSGTTAAVSLQLADDLSADRNALAAQQSLLQVPPEQARTLHPELDEAIRVALDIAERRNPALQTQLPLTELYLAFEMTSFAAALQAEALEAQKVNSVDPEPSLASTVSRANGELGVLLGAEPGSIEEVLVAVRAKAIAGESS